MMDGPNGTCGLIMRIWSLSNDTAQVIIGHKERGEKDLWIVWMLSIFNGWMQHVFIKWEPKEMSDLAPEYGEVQWAVRAETGLLYLVREIGCGTKITASGCCMWQNWTIVRKYTIACCNFNCCPTFLVAIKYKVL
jgi:hypothetical protein